METCDINRHFGRYKEYFESYNDIHTYYCPSIRNQNQTIYGIYGGIHPFAFYLFHMSLCINSTANNGQCYSFTEIAEKLEGTYFDIRTLDYTVNSKEKQPNALYIRNDRFPISKSTYKRIWMYFDAIDYYTDSDIILKDEEMISFFKVSDWRFDTDFRDIMNPWDHIEGTFLNLSILLTGKNKSIYRSYQKLQTLIANIGGEL